MSAFHNAPHVERSGALILIVPTSTFIERPPHRLTRFFKNNPPRKGICGDTNNAFGRKEEIGAGTVDRISDPNE